MSAAGAILPAAELPAFHIPDEAVASPPSQRQDGWTPARRRTFLTLVAEGHTVEAACGAVGLSVASAYALRRRAGGAAFALGWAAAGLLARDRLADALMARALHGQEETITRDDGSTIIRHRFDNRLATAMLARLDRLAEAAAPAPGPTRPEQAVAGDFDPFLDLVAADGAADEVARFVAARAPAPAADSAPQLPQLRGAGDPLDGEPAEDGAAEEEDDAPVWFDEDEQQWLTHLPPPADFAGREWERYGDPDYRRTLTLPEEQAQRAREEEALAELHAMETAERDAWFGFAGGRYVRPAFPMRDPMLGALPG